MNEYESDEKQFNCGCCYSKGNWKQMLWMDETEVYGEILSQTFNIIISQDNISATICEQCIVRLREAVTFKQLVLDTQRQFQCKLESEMPVEYLEGYEDVALLKQESHGDSDYNIENDFDDDSSDSEYEETLQEILLKRKSAKTTTVGGKLRNVGSSRKLKSKMDDCVDSDAPSSSKKEKIKGHQKGVRENDPVRERQNRDASVLVKNSNMLAFRWRNNKYMCFCCKETYLEMHLLRKHSESVHTKDAIVVEIHNRYNPVLPKVDITNLTCALCNDLISNVANLRSHLLEKHKVQPECSEGEPLLPYRLGDGEFKCQVCGQTFEVFKTLNNHMNKHFGSHICCTCGVAFQHKFALKCHEKRHKSKQHRCQKCNTDFPTSYKKLLHDYSLHKKGGRYGCPHCEEKFMDYDKRTKHLAKNHGIERPGSACTHCEKIFKNNRLLNQHVRYLHLNERKHVCFVCGNKYFTKSELKKHTESHNQS